MFVENFLIHYGFDNYWICPRLSYRTRDLQLRCYIGEFVENKTNLTLMFQSGY